MSSKTEFFNVAAIEHLPGGAKTTQEVLKTGSEELRRIKAMLQLVLEVI